MEAGSAESTEGEKPAANKRSTRQHRNQLQRDGGAVVRCDGEAGVVRVKLLMTRQQLRQMMAAMARGKNGGGGGGSWVVAQAPAAAGVATLDQQLQVLQRLHRFRRAEAPGERRSSWRPELQSIPEEVGN